MVIAVWLGTASDSEAVLFADSADPGHNTTAPTGTYEDGGWQYLGYYGSYLGTAIAPQYFITAQHFGTQGSTFSQASVFTGGASVDYTINTAANGGLGYWDIAGSDLRIFQINETFSTYAPLYTGLAIGEDALLTGRGGVRGTALFDGPTLKGYEHNPGDGVARWGTNTISSTSGFGAGTLLVATFDDLPGGPTDEAGLSDGDSGGGLFVFDGGVWKLAGVNYAVDGDFDTNNITGDGTEFSASLFDRGGYYQGSDSEGWALQNDLPLDRPSHIYFSSIANNASAIQAIAVVPEPAGALMVGLALGVVGLSRRRRS